MNFFLDCLQEFRTIAELPEPLAINQPGAFLPAGDSFGCSGLVSYDTVKKITRHANKEYRALLVGKDIHHEMHERK